MACGRQFQNHSRKERIEQTIWKEYTYQRQTIQSLAIKYGRSKNWIRDRLRNAPIKEHCHNPQPVVVIADATFFGRSFGLCVMRAPNLKKNIYVRKVQTESVDVYRQGRIELERQGYAVLAIFWTAGREYGNCSLIFPFRCAISIRNRSLPVI